MHWFADVLLNCRNLQEVTAPSQKPFNHTMHRYVNPCKYSLNKYIKASPGAHVHGRCSRDFGHLQVGGGGQL